MLNEENKNNCTDLQPDPITNNKMINDVIRAQSALHDFYLDFDVCDTDEFFLSLKGGEYALLRGYLKAIKKMSKKSLAFIKLFEDTIDIDD